LASEVQQALNGDKGLIDLTFNDTAAYVFQPLIKHLLHPEMTVHQTGAAAAIRIKSDGFKIADGLAATRHKIKAAFEASARLIQFYRRSREELDRHAKTATPT
jgi:hypothetical protein